eukprot:6438667-Pyramimonas_sp.AAC.1
MHDLGARPASAKKVGWSGARVPYLEEAIGRPEGTRLRNHLLRQRHSGMTLRRIAGLPCDDAWQRGREGHASPGWMLRNLSPSVEAHRQL